MLKNRFAEFRKWNVTELNVFIFGVKNHIRLTNSRLAPPKKNQIFYVFLIILINQHLEKPQKNFFSK